MYNTKIIKSFTGTVVIFTILICIMLILFPKSKSEIAFIAEHISIILLIGISYIIQDLIFKLIEKER